MIIGIWKDSGTCSGLNPCPMAMRWTSTAPAVRHPTGKEKLATNVSFDPYPEHGFERFLDNGILLLLALNRMNRSMGEQDPYPFTISEPVKYKLGFIHYLVKRSAV